MNVTKSIVITGSINVENGNISKSLVEWSDGPAPEQWVDFLVTVPEDVSMQACINAAARAADDAASKFSGTNLALVAASLAINVRQAVVSNA